MTTADKRCQLLTSDDNDYQNRTNLDANKAAAVGSPALAARLLSIVQAVQLWNGVSHTAYTLSEHPYLVVKGELSTFDHGLLGKDAHTRLAKDVPFLGQRQSR